MQETTLDVVAIQPSTEQRIQMAYRHDPDLEFLGKMKSSELNELVLCLTHDKDGSARLTEELTMSDTYKKYAPDHSKYWGNPPVFHGVQK